MPKASIRSEPCIALIADMVKSRDLPALERPKVQERFQNLIKELNTKYAAVLLSDFVITLGDEFQGLLTSASAIPDLIWDIANDFSDRELRVGLGLGEIHTRIPQKAINVDGPALHLARSAVNKAKLERALGGIFVGFGDLDAVLNGLARILYWQRSRLTSRQLSTLSLLRKGCTQSDTAEKLGVSRQVISKRVVDSGLMAYVEAENSWRTILRKFVDPMIGGEDARISRNG